MRSDDPWLPSNPGEVELDRRALDISAARLRRRTFAFGCMDWTERRPHLGGALGAAILDALAHQRVLERRSGLRPIQELTSLDDWINPKAV
jgi:hypothetical protein